MYYFCTLITKICRYCALYLSNIGKNTHKMSIRSSFAKRFSELQYILRKYNSKWLMGIFFTLSDGFFLLKRKGWQQTKCPEFWCRTVTLLLPDPGIHTEIPDGFRQKPDYGSYAAWFSLIKRRPLAIWEVKTEKSQKSNLFTQILCYVILSFCHLFA